MAIPSRLGGSPARGATAQGAAHVMQRRRRRAALLAFLFPLFFFLVIALGLAAMYYGHMSIFKPPAVGAGLAPDALARAAAPRAGHSG